MERFVRFPNVAYVAVERCDLVAWGRENGDPRRTETVSLDVSLCPNVVSPALLGSDWSDVPEDDPCFPSFLRLQTLLVALEQVAAEYQILAYAYNPNSTASKAQCNGFRFLGYDLMDRQLGVSALTNCCGFDHRAFRPYSLGLYGLLSEFEEASEAASYVRSIGGEHSQVEIVALWRGE